MQFVPYRYSRTYNPCVRSRFQPQVRDDDWFDRHVLAHESSLRNYLGRYLPNAADVADTLHDVYSRLLLLADAERDRIRSPQAYLFATARHLALDRLRQRRTVSLDELTESERLGVLGYEPPPDDAVNARQEFTMLARVIASLPERCRQVMSLRALFGLPQKEIARRLGMAEHTVEKHLGHGLRLCTKRLRAIAGTSRSASDTIHGQKKVARRPTDE